MSAKRCPKCSQSKDPTEFYKNRSRLDGLDYYCKPCRAETNNAYRLSFTPAMEALYRTAKP